VKQAEKRGVKMSNVKPDPEICESAQQCAAGVQPMKPEFDFEEDLI